LGERFAHAPGVVVGGFGGRDHGGARHRVRGIPHPGAHRAGAGGRARPSPARHPGRRPGGPRGEERLQHPVPWAFRPALRRGDGVRRSPRGRRIGSCDRRPGGRAAQTRPAAARGHRARGAMLSLSREQQSRTARRPPRSLKQEYHEFLLQRIEEYKNTLMREELLEIGDEAVRELEESAAALPAALFIAAHDAEVFLLDQDLAAIEGAESRAITEQLAGRFQALVVTFGTWFPDVSPSVVVIDPAALAPARTRDRNGLLAE